MRWVRTAPSPDDAGSSSRGEGRHASVAVTFWLKRRRVVFTSELFPSSPRGPLRAVSRRFVSVPTAVTRLMAEGGGGGHGVLSVHAARLASRVPPSCSMSPHCRRTRKNGATWFAGPSAETSLRRRAVHAQDPGRVTFGSRGDACLSPEGRVAPGVGLEVSLGPEIGPGRGKPMATAQVGQQEDCCLFRDPPQGTFSVRASGRSI